jgi:hypothetical protein
MIWERDPLWVKAKLFLGRAFEQDAEDPLYGLWCSLGLELLARAAVASVSPLLLADPDPAQRSLLHALGHGSTNTKPKSVTAVQVIDLCSTLFGDFNKDDLKSCRALIDRRNAELHSAEAAFETYPSKQWLPGFYRVCAILTKALGESLESLLGAEQAMIATEVLRETRQVVQQRVLGSIAAYKRVFNEKTDDERREASQSAAKETAKLVYERHHKVTCPACDSDAVVEGATYGPETPSVEVGEIVVRQSVSPRRFSCSACGLKLTGFAELDAADLGGTYTRRKKFTPEDYYGLIDPETADMSEYVEQYLAEMHEYDNE